MKLGIVIPWKETPSRIKPFNFVVDWYKTNFPDAEIFLSSRSEDKWEPSGSRNDGVRRAQGALCDVLVIGDADTIPQFAPLQEAIEQALKDGMIHNPYTIAHYLDEDCTELFYKGVPDPTSLEAKVFYESCGGIYVCTPQAWWDLGGMDEKFMQWGCEDIALQYAHSVIKQSNFPKHTGYIFCLNHAKQEKDPGFQKSHYINSELYREYIYINDPDELLKVIKRPYVPPKSGR